MEAAEKFNVGNYLSVSYLVNTNKKIVLYKNIISTQMLV